ncbi:MAG: hypothetical protein SF051_09430, partial [Elusimicrobiota bacterium]|nr:hypothetical protein [Elusimicrobiota bacterium]
MGRQSQRDDADALLDRVARRRFVRFAASRLAGGAAGLDAARASAIERLPPGARRRLFLDPAFARLASAPRAAALALCGHSTTIPLVAAGLHPAGPVRLRADARGLLRFAGHPVAVDLGPAAAGRSVAARWTGAALRAAGVEVPAEELLRGPLSPRSRALRHDHPLGVECGPGTPFFAAAAA